MVALGPRHKRVKPFIGIQLVEAAGPVFPAQPISLRPYDTAWAEPDAEEAHQERIDTIREALDEDDRGRATLPYDIDVEAAFSERRNGGFGGEEPDLPDIESLAVMLDGWKLVKNLNVPEGRSELELYSHVDDPLNLDDVAADHLDIVERLAAEIDTWQEGPWRRRSKRNPPTASRRGNSPSSGRWATSASSPW